ncbi:hypothetical protein EG328_008162 [Venturia inaequalis]|uniref:DASH complex subunit SPC19 n=1 Tax=Venturia inaequalis TaxID=5025 RepID=A0A8H3UYK7_VENIN|nr:hypothetical protein EG328_008162 [Venturia inaequalis]KAE9977613.1 hypothetical protein EG327_007679 [Venturia inaequalis]RDI80137.1 hypothetical protein Vi05172_g9822 [Venturia inaequalis]
MAHSLQGCVSSLRETIGTLSSSIRTLDQGVNDFPRLAKVLQTTRHFELISEPSLQSAQSALLSEIQPEVTSLLTRVSTYLDKLERREQSLIAKHDLQQGRLDSSSSTRPASRGRPKSFSKPTSGNAGRDGKANLTGLDIMKMKQLRQKKERLTFAIERLQLQAGQRERQLRKSMAAPQDMDF